MNRRSTYAPVREDHAWWFDEASEVTDVERYLTELGIKVHGRGKTSNSYLDLDGWLTAMLNARANDLLSQDVSFWGDELTKRPRP